MSKKQKNRILTVRIGETPTQERRSHDGGVKAEIVDRDISDKVLIKRYRAVWECPLDTYLDRAAISPPEHRVGQKFRRAYFRAVFGIRVEDVGSGCEGDFEMSMLTPIYSQRILKQAYEALSLKQKEIVINVCGHDEVAGSTAKVKTLHRALERLTDLWGQDIADNGSGAV
jgi:hypothetical protein